MAGDMNRRPLGPGKELAEGHFGSPKGNPAQPRFPQRIGQRAAQMPAPHSFGMDHPHTGKGEARFGIPGAERRQPSDVVDQRALRRGK